MFSEVEVELFRGIRGCEGPVRLSRVNLLIGPNNSGKTTLLEAMFLTPLPWSAYLIPIIGLNRGQFLARLHSPQVSYRYAHVATIRCVMEGRRVEVELHPEGSWRSIKVDGQEVSSPISFAGALGYEVKDEGAAIDLLGRYAIFIPNSDDLIKHIISEEAHQWESIEATGAHVRVVRHVLSRAIDERLTEVALKRNQLVVRKELPDDVAYIDLRDQGDGVERFLAAALLLEALRPRVVLWDDLEASAHPSLIDAVLEWLIDRDWQVVATTHSIDVLRGLVDMAPKDASVIVLRRGPDDVLRHKAYTVDEVAELIDRGLDPRRLLEWA